jgi:hypothetical protein
VAVEQTIRIRCEAFLSAINTSQSLGLVASHIFRTPPPNWPVEKGATVEVESESVDSRVHETQMISSAERVFVVKIGVFWGNVLPSTRMENIESKISAVRSQIEQSTYLMDGIKTGGSYATGDGQESFDYIDVTDVEKRYDGSIAVAGIITMRWAIISAWQKDTTIT